MRPHTPYALPLASPASRLPEPAVEHRALGPWDINEADLRGRLFPLQGETVFETETDLVLQPWFVTLATVLVSAAFWMGGYALYQAVFE